MRKHMLSVILFLFTASLLFSQNLVITQKDGKILRIPVSNIMSITFEEGLTSSSSQNAVKTTYTVGEKGPAGGTIIYDKGQKSDGWRYIEMAPASAEGKEIPWYPESNDVFLLGTGSSYGEAKRNTELIIEKYRAKGLLKKPNDWAVSYCDNLAVGGYDDWFMPTFDEVLLMYRDFHRNGQGGFSNQYYWTSSEYDGYNVWYVNFETGTQYVMSRDWELNVRPVRYF